MRKYTVILAYPDQEYYIEWATVRGPFKEDNDWIKRGIEIVLRKCAKYNQQTFAEANDCMHVVAVYEGHLQSLWGEW